MGGMLQSALYNILCIITGVIVNTLFIMNMMILLIASCLSISTAQGIRAFVEAKNASFVTSKFVYIYTCSPVILQHPTDRTVFLDNSAFFSCLTRGGSNALWRLNGTDYEDLPSELRNDLVTSNGSTSLSEFIDLIILSRAEYNETRVQCVIENGDGDSVVSDTAILYLQGHKMIVYFCQARQKKEILH